MGEGEVYQPEPFSRTWSKWFAWRPVDVHGERTWMKTVYRRRSKIRFYSSGHGAWEYGSLFDVIKEPTQVQQYEANVAQGPSTPPRNP